MVEFLFVTVNEEETLAKVVSKHILTRDLETDEPVYFYKVKYNQTIAYFFGEDVREATPSDIARWKLFLPIPE